MTNYAFFFVAFLSSALTLNTMAGELRDNRGLSTLQVVYVEDLPKEDAPTQIITLLKRFEPSSDSQRITEAAITTNESIYRARKIVIDSGFVDLPVPLLTHLTQGFNEREIETIPVFRTRIRSKEEKEDVLNKLISRLGPIPEGGPGKSQHTLMLLPYRIAITDGGNAALKIGALLFDEKNKTWIWIYYLTINFGEQKSITDELTYKLAMKIIHAMENGEGWVAKK